MILELMFTHSFLRNRAIKKILFLKFEIMCQILKKQTLLNSTRRIHATLGFGTDSYEHHTELDPLLQTGCPV